MSKKGAYCQNNDDRYGDKLAQLLSSRMPMEYLRVVREANESRMYSFARCHGDWDIVIKVIRKQEYSILEFQRGLYKTFFNGLIRNKGRAGFSREEIINKWVDPKRGGL
jgi:hypothetical protein